MDGVISIKVDDYNGMYRDAVDCQRLKTFIKHKRNSYYGITREEVATLCKMFGLEQEEEE